MSFYCLYSQISKLHKDELIRHINATIYPQLSSEDQAKFFGDAPSQEKTKPVDQSIIDRDRKKLRKLLGSKK